MSSFSDLQNLECTVTNCLFYETNGILGPSFLAGDLYPIYLSIGLYSIGLYSHEVYLLLISFALTADWGINQAFKQIIRESGPFPGCSSEFQNPSFSTEHAILFETLMISFIIIWRKRVSTYKIFLLKTFVFFVLLSRVYIGINTRGQLLVGAIFGSIEGLLIQFVIYYFIAPHFPWIIDSKIGKFFGLEDNLCNDKRTLYNQRSEIHHEK